MQIKVQSGDIATFQADAIVVNLFEGIDSPGGGTGAVDEALGGEPRHFTVISSADR